MRYLILLLTSLAGAAYATDKPPNHSQWQDQSQEQEQNQYTEQWSEQVNAQTAEQSISIVPENDITLRNTAPAIAPNIYPAGNCYMVWSGGIGIPGFNATGGKSVLDDGCRKLEWVRMAYQIGMRDAAIHALCSMPEASGVPQCDPAQDYNRETKLIELDNAELLKERDDLRHRIDVLVEERQNLIEKHNYDMDKCRERCTK